MTTAGEAKCQKRVLAQVFRLPTTDVPSANGEILDRWLRERGYVRRVVEHWKDVPKSVHQCSAIFRSRKHLHATHLGLATRAVRGYILSYADGYGDPIWFEYYEEVKR